MAASTAEHAGLATIDIIGHSLHIDNAMVGTWGLTVLVLIIAFLVYKFPMNGAVLLFKSVYE